MDLAPHAEALVSLRGISKHFGAGETRIDALRDISLDVFPGEVVALRGPSGSGKTTLLNVIACILDPASGVMSLEGEVVFDRRWLRHDLRRLRLDKIGFIFQFHNLLPFLNATDNVALVLQLAGYALTEATRRAIELLEYLEVGNRRSAFPAKLSGGEAQRVAIARALANRPRIILADEPTAALNSKRAQIVMDLLRKLAVDQSAAVIAVTHDEKIFDRFDRMFMLRDGRLDDERPMPWLREPMAAPWRRHIVARRCWIDRRQSQHLVRRQACFKSPAGKMTHGSANNEHDPGRAHRSATGSLRQDHSASATQAHGSVDSGRAVRFPARYHGRARG